MINIEGSSRPPGDYHHASSHQLAVSLVLRRRRHRLPLPTQRPFHLFHPGPLPQLARTLKVVQVHRLHICVGWQNLQRSWEISSWQSRYGKRYAKRAKEVPYVPRSCIPFWSYPAKDINAGYPSFTAFTLAHIISPCIQCTLEHSKFV